MIDTESQLIFDEQKEPTKPLLKNKIIRKKFVIQIKGTVIERVSKNPNMATGDIEILVSELTILNESTIASIYYRRQKLMVVKIFV